MVDLHHHLLPGLDDGARDLETSVAMARIAAGDGITRVVCTPHASSRYAFEPGAVAAALDRLRAALQDAGIALELASGCDFHVSYDNVEDALAHPRKYTIAQGNYLLVELPDFSLPPSLAETLYELRIGGMTPILTHPERNPTLQKNLDRMADWLRAGLLVQVTAGSVLGEMGGTARKAAEQLLHRRWVHFLATDAHDTERRPPRMRAARELVAKRYGPDYSTLLCETNPLAVWEGRPLPPQPEPKGLYEQDDEDGAAKPSIWKRWFGQR